VEKKYVVYALGILAIVLGLTLPLAAQDVNDVAVPAEPGVSEGESLPENPGETEVIPTVPEAAKPAPEPAQAAEGDTAKAVTPPADVVAPAAEVKKEEPAKAAVPEAAKPATEPIKATEGDATKPVAPPTSDVVAPAAELKKEEPAKALDATAVNEPSKEALPATPLLQWNFDEGEGDFVQSTVAGSPLKGDIDKAVWVESDINIQFENWVMAGNALVFNGSGAKVESEPTETLFASPTITLSAWAWPQNPKELKQERFMIMAGEEGFGLFIDRDQKVSCYQGSLKPENSITSAKGSIHWDHWYAISCIFDGNKASLYLNGRKVEEGEIKESMVPHKGSFRVGSGFDQESAFFGKIDSVAVFSGVVPASSIWADYKKSANGLIARWKFDEGAGKIFGDISGQNNNGELFGVEFMQSKISDDLFGGSQSGAGLFFSGNSWAEVKDPSNIFTCEGEFSLETWVKFEDLSDGAIIAKQKSADYQKDGIKHISYALALMNGKFVFFVNGEGKDGLQYVVSNEWPRTSRWYHITAGYTERSDQGPQLSLHINGLLDNSQKVPKLTLSTEKGSLYLGGYYPNTISNHGFLRGSLDETSIYCHYLDAYLSNERYQRMASGLLARWEFNEGQGQDVVDSTGRRNNGKLLGSATFAPFNFKKPDANVVGKFVLALDGQKGNGLKVERTSISFTSYAAISAWIKPKACSADHPILFRDEQFSLGLNAECAVVGQVYVNNAWAEVVSKQTLQADNWYYLTLNYTNEKLSLFINGQADAEVEKTGSFKPVWSPIYIGTKAVVAVAPKDSAKEAGTAKDSPKEIPASETFSTSFDGEIKEVSIYDQDLEPHVLNMYMNMMSAVIMPVADIAAPKCGGTYFVGSPIFFDGARSFSRTGRVSTWKWDFQDGIVLPPQSLPQAFHYYSKAGNYQVMLWVEDEQGMVGEQKCPIEVREPQDLKEFFQGFLK
jgi:hypothetical protein